MTPRTEPNDVPVSGRTAEGRLLSAIVRTGDVQTAIANGVTGDMFRHYAAESEWLGGYVKDHGRVPSAEALAFQFPGFDVVEADDVAHHAAEVRLEHRRQQRFTAVSRMYDLEEAGDMAGAEAELLRWAATVSMNGTRGQVRSRLLADIQPESVNWLWPERVPLAAVTIVEGPPKTGKSTIATDLAARVSTGRAMPDDDGTDDPAGVIILSAEDHAARVIRPRLEAAGADLRRIRVVDGIDDIDDNGDAVVRPVALPDDIYRVEQVTRELGAQLVIVDPLMAYLSARVKGTVDQDVRRALLPLRELAERTNAAVLVIRHFRKSREGDAINWGGGSIGIAGAARSILQVGKDPKRADVRVLAHVASNYGPECASLAYRIAGVQTKRADTSKVEWIGETELTAEDLGRASQGPGRPATERTDAELWLQDVLEGGPLPVKQLMEKAESDGQAWRTVENAKKALGIVAERLKDHWVWRLP